MAATAWSAMPAGCMGKERMVAGDEEALVMEEASAVAVPAPAEDAVKVVAEALAKVVFPEGAASQEEKETVEVEPVAAATVLVA